MRPLLLLDVDGVLMPLGSLVPRGYERHVTESSNLVASSQHGVWLHELSETFEIVWATTWEDSANDTFGTLFDLPRFDFVELTNLPRHGTRKLSAVKAFVGNRPTAWIDDELYDDAAAWAEERLEQTIYANNDPVNQHDPLGLRPTDKAYGAAIAGAQTAAFYLVAPPARTDLGIDFTLGHGAATSRAANQAGVDAYLLASIYVSEGSGYDMVPSFLQGVADGLNTRILKGSLRWNPPGRAVLPSIDGVDFEPTRRGHFGMHERVFNVASAFADRQLANVRFSDLDGDFSNGARAMAWWLAATTVDIRTRVLAAGGAIVASDEQVPRGAKALDIDFLLAGEHYRGDFVTASIALLTSGKPLQWQYAVEATDYGNSVAGRAEAFRSSS